MFYVIKWRKKMKGSLNVGRDASNHRGRVRQTNIIATTAMIMKFPTMINLC